MSIKRLKTNFEYKYLYDYDPNNIDGVCAIIQYRSYFWTIDLP